MVQDEEIKRVSLQSAALSVCGRTVMIRLFINYSADYFSPLIVPSAGFLPGGPNPPEPHRTPHVPDFKGCKKSCDAAVSFPTCQNRLNRPKVSLFEEVRMTTN